MLYHSWETKLFKMLVLTFEKITGQSLFVTKWSSNVVKSRAGNWLPTATKESSMLQITASTGNPSKGTKASTCCLNCMCFASVRIADRKMQQLALRKWRGKGLPQRHFCCESRNCILELLVRNVKASVRPALLHYHTCKLCLFSYCILDGCESV